MGSVWSYNACREIFVDVFTPSSMRWWNSAAGQESIWRQFGGSQSRLYHQKCLLFCSVISLFLERKNGWLWRRCWLGWSSCMLTFGLVSLVFLSYSFFFFSCFVINWLGRYFSSVHQMRKETMKLLYRSACKTLQLKISSWNLTFSTISGGNV